MNDELKWYLANTRYALGYALQTSGKQGEAKVYFQRCLATRKELFRMSPTNIQRRIELMLVNAQLGNAQAAVEDAWVVEQYAPHHPGKLYSAGCAYALSAKSVRSATRRQSYEENAVRLLRAAITNGLRDTWALQNDSELENLRGNSAYKQLLNYAQRVS